MARTVYFVGSEPDCVTGSYGLSTTGVDTNYVRTGFYTQGGQSAQIELQTATPDNSTEGYWLHFRKYSSVSDIQLGGYKQNPLLIYDGSGNLSFYLNVSSASGSYGYVSARVYASNGSAVDSGIDYDTFANATEFTTQDIDVHVYTNSSGHAVAEFYRNNTLRQTVTNTGGSSRGMKRAVFTTPVTYNGSYSYVVFSEFIVANFDTRNLRVGTYIPSADGTYTDGAGTYADIDETSPDGNAITLAAVGDKQSYTVSKLGSPSLSGILALAVNGLVASDGTNDLQAGLRIGGADYFSSDLGLGASPSATSVVWNTNPADGGYLPQNPATDIEVIYKAVA